MARKKPEPLTIESDGYSVLIEGQRRFFAYGKGSGYFFTGTFRQAIAYKNELAEHLPDAKCTVVKVRQTMEILA